MRATKTYRCYVHVTLQDGTTSRSQGVWTDERIAVERATMLKRSDTVAGVEVEVELWGRTEAGASSRVLCVRRYFV